MSTEDANLYYGTLTCFARSIRPGDLITWMLIKDLADHRLEIARYRRIKIGLMTATHQRELRSDPEWRTKRWVVELEPHQQKKLLEVANLSAEETALARSAMTTEADLVDVFPDWIVRVNQIDRLLQAAERRFSESLDEIDRHLHGLGRYCREELDKIIDGQLVEPQVAGDEAATRVPDGQSVPRDALTDTAPAALPLPTPTRRRAANSPRRSVNSKTNEPARRRLAKQR